MDSTRSFSAKPRFCVLYFIVALWNGVEEVEQWLEIGRQILEPIIYANVIDHKDYRLLCISSMEYTRVCIMIDIVSMFIELKLRRRHLKVQGYVIKIK